jgi:HPt (histidine-containing phosphotransfer) domain-containing protein
MDEFLAKPVRAAELLAAIDRVRRTQADRIDAIPLLAASVLLAACGEDADALRELCADFREFAPARLAQAREALQKGNMPRLREEAHKLQGLLSAFSAVACQVAFELEDDAACGRFELARDCLARLKGMSSQLQSELEQVSVESLRERA